MDEIKQVITASSSRKNERAERAKAEDFDAEEGELLKEENEQEEEVFDQVCPVLTLSKLNVILFYIYLCLTSLLLQIGEILGTLIKTFKAAFLPFFEELSSYLMPMWVSAFANYQSHWILFFFLPNLGFLSVNIESFFT